MPDVHREAHQHVIQCLIAALIVRPLDAALTDDEVEELVVASGISIAVYREIATEGRYGKGGVSGKRLLGSGDLLLMLVLGDGHYPVALFPKAPIVALRTAFEELDREYGKTYPKALSVLISKCAPASAEAVALALGMAVALGIARKSGDGNLLDSDLDDLVAEPHRAEAHPWVSHIQSLVPMVENVIARRTGTLVPSLSPLDRFHRVLAKQNLPGACELVGADQQGDGIGEQTPSDGCNGARRSPSGGRAGGDRRASRGGWLLASEVPERPAESWKLGKLVDQAGVAGTLGAPDVALARNLVELRNRIHAGKYSTAGKGPFRPASVNAHEAELARLSLLRVIDVILGWPPILKRT